MGIQAALNYVGARAKILRQSGEVGSLDGLVLPGVGNFGPASRFLRHSGFGAAIQDAARALSPVLGICLGFHLLCQESEEAPLHAGLGIFDAQVKRIKLAKNGKVPHMGWTRVDLAGGRPIPGLTSGERFYFAHSFQVFFSQPSGSNYVATYGGMNLLAAHAQKSVLGVQFHPEKSGDFGLKFLREFAS
jgi:imidazole glycerol phosphate synthase, glutamine amidotransferase subunit